MSTPRLEIDLAKIQHNARTLTARLAVKGIRVTAVTKATSGSIEIADALLRAGVTSLGDSRIENISAMRRANLSAKMSLIRSPMLSQISQVVQNADISFNTELAVIRQLSRAAQEQRRTHGIVLMVELGDIREGLMPAELHHAARLTLDLPNLTLEGIGTNLACRSGVLPDEANMAELSMLADSIEATFGITLNTVTGGNSANLAWALGNTNPGRINDLRLGEAILLGQEPINQTPIPGLHTDTITFIAEVIETKTKPLTPWGTLASPPNPTGMTPAQPIASAPQSILAVGHQDTDPNGLKPPTGLHIQTGATSDHTIISSEHAKLRVGAQIRFQTNYNALTRALASPFVTKATKPITTPATATASHAKHSIVSTADPTHTAPTAHRTLNPKYDRNSHRSAHPLTPTPQ